MFVGARIVTYADFTFTAFVPRASAWMSNDTLRPSDGENIPDALTVLTWMNTSLSAPSGLINPTPLESSMDISLYARCVVVPLQSRAKSSTPADGTEQAMSAPASLSL